MSLTNIIPPYLKTPFLPLLPIILLPLLPLLYNDYTGWLALGPGGLPHNVFGWLIQSLMRIPASRNVRDTSLYDKEMEENELEETSFLEGRLEEYAGEGGGGGPKTGKWVVPHRQLEGGAGEDVKEALLAELHSIATSNPTLLTLSSSLLEGSTPALFLNPQTLSPNSPQPPTHKFCTRSPHEVFHIHSSAEGSSHAVLSAADAKLVLERGWGERHGLSGRALGFPAGYVMVFAPRGVEEVREVVGRVARAAVGYALEGRGEVR